MTKLRAAPLGVLTLFATTALGATTALVGGAQAQAPAAGAVSEVVVTGEKVRSLEQFTPTGSRLNLSAKDTPATLDTIDAATIEARGYLLAAGRDGPQVLVLKGADAKLTASVPLGLLTDAAARGWTLASAAAHGPEQSDALYRLAEGLPDRALRFDLAQPKGAGLYIDPVTGRTLALVDNSRKTYAWVYFALHTFNFPVLIDRPILRRVLELIPILFGFLFSLTGLVIAIKRLRIAFAP